MTEREALKLALEALEAHADIGIKADKAITAIREALAQPEQEPVAWMTITPYGDEDDVWYENPEGKLLEGWTYKPLYDTTPPQPEPVIDKSAAIRIATALGWEPKRTWVGLTEKEYKQVINAYFGTGLWAMAKNIEAKLKEKNT